ncbi:polysaccharide biosynthesis tyrosine autokinase [Caenimonas soli]|uniref:polysaccharide biosynthesis tyrosine autokinase n=1 Tax=Caenimonas soli TaxID=2735555 RepID=UPI001556928A|nr:polysaccharide biosynthesis tyrosine autokinase [Caenimonas soli]NPC57473.1 polysaccharide biosynthesis tyrosine autokinase [Caenimonas soli]
MLEISSIPVKPNAGNGEDQLPALSRDRPIGYLLCQSKGLQPSQVEQILVHQRRHGGRFGEAAIALGLATEEDILEVLARQFEYPYVRTFDDSAIDAELVCACDPLGEDAQSFRELRSELLTGVLDRSTPRALAVLSPQIGDGRSYVAANLALACAQLGGRTLLVDADMRTPRLHTLFEIDDSVGLSKLLRGGVMQEVVQQAHKFPGLFLLAAGPTPPNPLELLQRSAFSKLLREWLAKFDHVVLDTPAASYGPEARVIAATAGAALAVARPHATRIADLQRLLSSIEKGPAALAGVVMNEH